MKEKTGLVQLKSEAVVGELMKILADEYVLSTKTRSAHWNVTGEDFYDKHKFFESQFFQLDEFIDSIAERIRSIGHYAPASLGSFIELTQLTEKSSNITDGMGLIKELLCDHEAIIIRLRKNIEPFSVEYKDVGTSDFITDLMEEHEKMAWFLRSHLPEVATASDPIRAQRSG